MGVVGEWVEDDVADSGIADNIVPVVDGDLASERRATAAVAMVEEFVSSPVTASTDARLRSHRFRCGTSLRISYLRWPDVSRLRRPLPGGPEEDGDFRFQKLVPTPNYEDSTRAAGRLLGENDTRLDRMDRGKQWPRCEKSCPFRTALHGLGGWEVSSVSC